MRSDAHRHQTPPDIAEFIRFCHRRRRVSWPEIYDEMCAVAAQKAFHGWDHDELARRGLTFTLFEMPQLARWVREVLAELPAAPEAGIGQALPQAAPG
ncbi:MAG TPA: hypothetical protein VF071_10980 [Candidatus Limnocylindria bacterium]